MSVQLSATDTVLAPGLLAVMELPDVVQIPDGLEGEGGLRFTPFTFTLKFEDTFSGGSVRLPQFTSTVPP